MKVTAGDKILVTGATGQIGSELVPELRKRYGRENVVATGHLRRPTREMEDSGPFLTLDLMEQETVSETMKIENIGQVYHLAAMLSAEGLFCLIRFFCARSINLQQKLPIFLPPDIILEGECEQAAAWDFHLACQALRLFKQRLPDRNSRLNVFHMVIPSFAIKV